MVVVCKHVRDNEFSRPIAFGSYGLFTGLVGTDSLRIVDGINAKNGINRLVFMIYV